MSIQKILKVGNSLGLTLPSGLVKSLSLRSGDNVDVVRGQGNNLIISFPDSHQLSLELTRIQKTPKKNI